MDYIVKQIIPDYMNVQNMLAELKNKYPFARYDILGRSCCSREIITLSLGNGNNPILYVGGFHAQEWLTVLLLLRFFEKLCICADSHTEMSHIDVCGLLETRKLIIIPCINPDGVEIALNGFESAGYSSLFCKKIGNNNTENWNANARGVDINHNFDAGWHKLQKLEVRAGITGPAPKQYGGRFPESEPETKALTRLCRESSIRHALAFHSQGEEIYWQYGKNMPERSYMMAKILAASSEYTLIQNEGLASHGGFKDWVIDKLHVPAFTIEIGKGKNPLPITELDSVYERLEEMLLLSLLM